MLVYLTNSSKTVYVLIGAPKLFLESRSGHGYIPMPFVRVIKKNARSYFKIPSQEARKCKRMTRRLGLEIFR